MLKGGMHRILGTMSGTSLDGVDAAVLVTDGVEIAGFGDTAFRPYSDDERDVLRAALGSHRFSNTGSAGDEVQGCAARTEMNGGGLPRVALARCSHFIL